MLLRGAEEIRKMMLTGNFQTKVLQFVNILLGMGATALLLRGFLINDGLAGLGLVLLTTSLLAFFGLRSAEEQLAREGTETRREPELSPEEHRISAAS
jgi:hypothetical protein